jgi:hypothetical protein
MSRHRLGLLVVAAALGLAGVARAADQAAAAAPPAEVTITLKDGGTLVGTVVAEDEGSLRLRTRSGVELELPREAVAARGPAPAATEARAASPRSDPNESRLMFAPTGRPLGKGNGYFSDHYVLFPGFAVGLTDNLSLAGGVSTIPAISLEEQVFYLSASSGFRLGRNTALAVGGFVAGSGGDVGLEGVAALFGVATFGPSDRSLSLGVAALAEREYESSFGPRGEYLGETSAWRFRDAPVVMIGGSLRLSRSISLISESWLLLGDDFDLAEQPFGFALRFFGGRLSADVGVVLVKEVIDEGFPVPWLSFSYHFGPSRRSTARDDRPALPAWARASMGGGR